MTRRLGIANQAFSQHRRILFRNPHLAWDKRREIFTTLVLSKLVYGFESWTFETQQIRHQLHAGIIKLYKRLLGHKHAAHLTDEEVLVETNLPSPTDLLRGCRLRYFGTLYNCGRAAHWGLLTEDRQWIELIEDDFKWLWKQLRHNTDLPDPVQHHYPVWHDLFTPPWWLLEKAHQERHRSCLPSTSQQCNCDSIALQGSHFSAQERLGPQATPESLS